MRRLTSALPFLLLLACAALVGAACTNPLSGPLSKSEYEQEVGKLEEDARGPLQDLFDSEESPSEEEIAKASDALDQLADDLDGLDPPDEIKDAHGNFVSGLRGMADWIDTNAEVLANADENPDTQAQAVELLRAIPQEQWLKDLTEAQQEYCEKDYDVFASGTTPGGDTEDDPCAEVAPEGADAGTPPPGEEQQAPAEGTGEDAPAGGATSEANTGADATEAG